VSRPHAIELLAAAAASDDELVGEITSLVNRVYAVAEAGLWVDGVSRTTNAEVAEMVATRQIALARVDGQIVGVVRIRQLGAETGEFGMLVADPARRGEGIGRELVSYAEALSLERGLGGMQLELLVPRGWTHPTKAVLHEWYTRMDYRPVRSGSLDDSYPLLASQLAVPCDFVVYHKTLPLTLDWRVHVTTDRQRQKGVMPCASPKPQTPSTMWTGPTRMSSWVGATSWSV
jgi:GNAT superfamily N-acetyltransferase